MPYADPARQRQYQAEWIARRRSEWFAEHGPCLDCGTWENLELDHVDPSTKVAHRIWSWSADRRAAELEKCVIRCSTCHQRKSIPEHMHGEGHGAVKRTLTEIEEIRTRFAAGERQVDIAKALGTTRFRVHEVVRGRKWTRD